MDAMKKTIAIIQARLGSTRFPAKVIQPVCGTPLIEILIERLGRAQKIDQIVIATSDSSADDPLAEHLERNGHLVVRGSESDVLKRYMKAASLLDADNIVRITGDCPLIDPSLVDAVIDLHQRNQSDYTSNANPPTFPDGLDVEVFTIGALQIADKNGVSQHDREHVTPFIRESNKFAKSNYQSDEDHSDKRWTVDTPEDLTVVKKILEHFTPRQDFSWHEVLDLYTKNPEYFLANQAHKRNEGMRIGSGQKLWNRAKKVIPGGNMLLSKRSEMFLPDKWPSYYSRAKGCEVWDLDGNRFIDMSIMGIGTNVLGYGHPEVDEAVIETVHNGNMSTLNCPEEVYLAERLIKLHPWAEQVRLARTGGEANAIAVRIARAATKKDNIAICGYHGWHDWYLSANLGDDESLDGHLLPGLTPNGVPKNLRGSTLTFTYNNIDELEKLVRNNNIGVIKMEVQRNAEPTNDFLRQVRQLATENGIVLIFDECTSGFRETFGGLHQKYDVEPDIAIFGKTLGNGYAISAVIGRDEFMSAAQSTFISSTFWTERIGPTAACKTLEVMEREKSWETISTIGRMITDRWRKLASEYDLKIETNGLSALTNFSIRSENWLQYKTLITQEMLKKGYLASNAVYACTEHTDKIVNGYFEHLKPVFCTIRECEDGRNIENLLESPCCHAGFKRLN